MREDRDRRPRSRWLLGVLLGVAVAIVAVVAWRLWSPPVPSVAETRSERSGGKRETVEYDREIPPTDAGYAGEDRVLARGFALDASTGSPARGALVEYTDGDDRWETRTDARGAWSLFIPRDRPRGRMKATAEGYRRGRLGHLIIPAGAAEWRAPTFFLREICARVSVRVVDMDDNAVPGAVVGGLGSDDHRTDAGGRVEAVPVTAGECFVSARAFGYRRRGRALFIPPARPPARMSVEITLAPAEWIEVTIVDETGKPVPDVVVRESEDGPPRARSDARGRIRWPGVDGKIPSTHLTKPGHVEADMYPWGWERRIPFPRVTSVQGRVVLPTGEPGAGIRVMAGFGAHEGSVGVTDAEGRFTLGAVPAGSLSLVASARGLPLGQIHVKAKWPGPTTGIEFRLKALTTVRGCVVDVVTGEPLAGVTVWPVTPWPRLGKHVTDENGRFECVVSSGQCRVLPLGRPGYEPTTVSVDSLPAGGDLRIGMRPLGRVRLIVVCPDGRPVRGAVAVLKSWTESSASDERGEIVLDLPVGRKTKLRIWHTAIGTARVSVKAGPEETEHRVVLGGPDSIHEILVLDEKGEARPDAHALVSGVVYRADADGVIRVPGIDWGIDTLSAPGCERFSVPTEDWSGGGLRPVTLCPGASIRGRVVDLDGKGVGGIEIHDAYGSSPLETDAHGRFTIDRFATGDTVLLEAKNSSESRGRIGFVWAVAGGDEVVFVHPGFGHLLLSVAQSGEEGGVRFLRTSILQPGIRDPRTGWPAAYDLDLVTSTPVRLRLPAGPVVVLARADAGVLTVRALVKAGRETELVLPGVKTRGGLTGRVVDEAGRNIAFGDVSHALKWAGRLWVISDGRIVRPRTGGARGVMRLRFRAEGFADHVTEPLDLGTFPDLRVVLTRGGTVVVRVRDGEGEDVRARILREVGAHGSWTPCPATLHHVPAGRRRVEIRHGKRMPFVREVDVHEGRTTDLTVVMPD